MRCNKTYANGIYLHKFPKEMKDPRLLSVSKLLSSVLSDSVRAQDGEHSRVTLTYLYS